jgi:hypothetical protein
MGVGGIAPPFFTLTLDRGEWSASCPGRFIPSTHWIGGWVDLRAGLDAVVERRLALPLTCMKQIVLWCEDEEVEKKKW